MSRIKPNTHLPLFGVETEYGPGPAIFTSKPYPVVLYEHLGKGSFAGLDLPPPWSETVGGAALVTLGVEVRGTSVEYTTSAGDGDLGKAAFLSVGVQVKDTLITYDNWAAEAVGKSTLSSLNVAVKTVLITYSNWAPEPAGAAKMVSLGVTVA